MPSELVLHTPESELEHEESLAWVRWMFQSIRARRSALVFQSQETERPQLLTDWQRFVEQEWLPILAPAMLGAWQELSLNSLLQGHAKLQTNLCAESSSRSIVAGEMLMEGTRGAKYQAVLGQLRLLVEKEGHEPHLAMVWVAVAALFQLPVADLLSEYLRQEWLTALRECPHHAEPQGPLSFAGLAHRSLREAGFGSAFHS
jgi:hypothetical protein